MYQQQTNFNQDQTTGFGVNRGPVQSQYRGNVSRYEPVGYVQSFYQGITPSYQPTHQTGMQTSPMTSPMTGYPSSAYPSNYPANQESFHTAQYQGNQPDHDAYWRGDSRQPSNIGTGAWGSMIQSAPQTGMSSGYSSYQPQNTQAFHTSGYVGNQPDHDASWRADSQRPSSYTGGYR